MFDLEQLYVVSWSAKQRAVWFGTLADHLRDANEAVRKGYAADNLVVAAGDDFVAMRAECDRWTRLRDEGHLPSG